MVAVMVVVVYLLIQVSLQSLYTFVDSFAKSYSAKIIQQSSIKTFTNTICLEALHFSFRMINFTHPQIQLIIVIFTLIAALLVPR